MGEVNLSDLMVQVTENSKHIYPSHEFDSQLQPGIRIMGNAERLEQVLMNFINNSVKYSLADKKIILKTTINADVVRVSVSDYGIGLSEEQIERIFERFYRVEDKKFMTSGLGMGLYISAEIINNHQGKIGVESELGRGATFYFELPLII
ncbi:sensor histidine kinase [Mucilaginibacter lappiensis]